MQKPTYSDQPTLPLKFNDSGTPNTSPLLEKLRRIEKGLSLSEISPAPEIPELPPKDLVEDVRQSYLSYLRERIEPTIVVLEEERRKACDAGDDIRVNVVEKKLSKWIDSLKSAEADFGSQKFVDWINGIWEKARQKPDGNTNRQTEHGDGDPLSAIFPIPPSDSDMFRETIRFLENLEIDSETSVKKEANRRRGGRRTIWDGLREEIRKADKETPKPHDDVIANRYNKRFSSPISCDKRPRADANKVRQVRSDMRRKEHG